MSDTTLPVSDIEAANYTRTLQPKCYILLHDVECPPGPSWGEALATGYFRNPATKASTQYIVDADSITRMTPEDAWAWGSGSPSSRYAIHIEQAGYADFTRAQWLGLPESVGSKYKRPDGAIRTFTADDAASMRSQFVLVARLMGDICRRRGWTAQAATRDVLLREVQGENLGAHIRHVDARDWVGGTTHHDPGPDYPWEFLLSQVTVAIAGGIPNPDPSTPSVPTTPTAPTSPEEDDEMTPAQVNQITQAIADSEARLNARIQRNRLAIRDVKATIDKTLPRTVAAEVINKGVERGAWK